LKKRENAMEPECNHKLMALIRKGETDRSPQVRARERGRNPIMNLIRFAC
jgi:hypothetical protein